MLALSVAGAVPQAQAADGEVGDGGEQAGLHQGGVEDAHAAGVFAIAILDEAAEAEAIEEHIGLGDGELAAIALLLAAPDHAGEAAGGAAVEPGGFQRASDGGVAALFFAPGHVVDEEHDVASFLEHQHIEDVEHLSGKKFGFARGLEGAEAEEGIEALAEAEIDEGGLQIVGEGVQRLGGGVDGVALDHHPYQLGVAGLLAALQGDGFAYHGVSDVRGEGVDDGAGAALGMVDLLPEGHAAQAGERGFVEVGPGQGFGVVVLVAVKEMLAEKLFVFVRPGGDGHFLAFLRRGRSLRAVRVRNGTVVGRRSLGS
jgi:hypothetical protein